MLPLQCNLKLTSHLANILLFGMFQQHAVQAPYKCGFLFGVQRSAGTARMSMSRGLVTT